MRVVKCPNCGANNIDTGVGFRCEYCSGFIESKREPAPEKKYEPVLPPDKPKNSYTFSIPDLSEIPIVGKFFQKNETSKPSSYNYKNDTQPYPAPPAAPIKKQKNSFLRFVIGIIVFCFVISAVVGIVESIFVSGSSGYNYSDNYFEPELLSYNVKSNQLTTTSYSVDVTCDVYLHEYATEVIIWYDLYIERSSMDYYVGNYKIEIWGDYASGEYTFYDSRSVTCTAPPNKIKNVTITAY